MKFRCQDYKNLELDKNGRGSFQCTAFPHEDINGVVIFSEISLHEIVKQEYGFYKFQRVAGIFSDSNYVTPEEKICYKFESDNLIINK
jgi:hypothetical protein